MTSEGEKWAKMRKLANSTFHAESLKVISYSQSCHLELAPLKLQLLT